MYVVPSVRRRHVCVRQVARRGSGGARGGVDSSFYFRDTVGRECRFFSVYIPVKMLNFAEVKEATLKYALASISNFDLVFDFDFEVKRRF